MHKHTPGNKEEGGETEGEAQARTDAGIGFRVWGSGFGREQMQASGFRV
jgi:hypothetical protein